MSTMPTLSPVSKTNESGRELLILTGTTMCLVTSLKGIVTTGLAAEAFGADAAHATKTRTAREAARRPPQALP